MDITHTCGHCYRGKKVFKVSLDLYNDQGIMHPQVHQMKKFDFDCDFCFRKSRLDFYRFSHPDVILLLKRLEKKQDELIKALDNIISILENYLNV